MGAGKNSARRRKRISKHVLEAKEKRTKEDETLVTTSTPMASGSIAHSKRRSSKNITHEKDPIEAHAYLSSWFNRNLGTGVWKFNKNTQSWLVRHMYDAEKVKKETFTYLIQYIAESPIEGGLKQRALDDARRRATRYREWEKNQPTETTETTQQQIIKAAAAPDARNNPDEMGEKRWEELNAHDKRKEYKRARKLIEGLSTDGQGST